MSKERIRSCPCCYSDNYNIWFTMDYDHIKKYWNVKDDYLAQHEFTKDSSIDIVCCKDCGMHYNRTHSDWALRDFLAKKDEKEDDSQKQVEDRIPHHHVPGSTAIARNISMILNAIMSRRKTIYFHQTNLKVLDFSCGGGASLRMLRAFGVIDLFGYDINFGLAGKNNPFYIQGVNFYNDLDELAKEGPFDLIINQASMEHYDEPREMLNKMRGLLAPDGILAIAVPVVLYNEFPEFKKKKLQTGYAKTYFHPWHINHFSIPLVHKILKAANLKVLPITSAGMSNVDDIDWQKRKSIFQALRRSIITLLRICFSYPFFKFSYFPERLRMLYFNGWFFCTPNEKS